MVFKVPFECLAARAEAVVGVTVGRLAHNASHRLTCSEVKPPATGKTASRCFVLFTVLN